MPTSNTNTELTKGLVLGGKYRLEEEIGRGAMGTVWSAIHETLEQRVAIKVISKDHANSEELRRRFDNEARAAARLRSRFVVSVTDNGETSDGLPYIVMEYLEGECLEDRIARLGCVPLIEASRIARHVTRALSRAHARGIVHRDLKPANIFISKSEDDEDGEDWTAKVLDFGIAKMEDFGDRSATKTGTVLGTPLFMSPEQVRGASKVDSRADLYSLGMVIYNMLTGTFAFDGKSFGDLLVSICTDPLPELTRSAPHAPPSLDTWFKKACARNPDERYQTAEELLTGFQEAIGEPHHSSSRLSVGDVSAAFASGAFGPRDSEQQLANTYSAEDTASTGTPEFGSSQPTLESPRGGLDSAGASAVTVHDSSDKPKSNWIWAAAAAVVVLGAGTALMIASGGEAESAQSAVSPAEEGERTGLAPEEAEEDAEFADPKRGDSPSSDKPAGSDPVDEKDTVGEESETKDPDTGNAPAAAAQPPVTTDAKPAPSKAPKRPAPPPPRAYRKPAPPPKAEPKAQPKVAPKPKPATSEPDLLGF